MEMFGQILRDYLEIEESKEKETLKKYYEFEPKHDLKLNPGVERVVKYLKKNSIHIGIATFNTEVLINKVTKGFGNYFKPNNYFSHIVCGFDNPEIIHNKPNPEIYLNCLKKFEKQPISLGNVLIIEDTLKCAMNAVNAGMKSLLVNENVEMHDLSDNQGLTVIKTLNDFKPENFGLKAIN